ncbi:UPF0149 family protein [Acidovorax sp. SUPP3334]|uniref:UPF0149 family protein n=1 Tax=Acidovorax sp. SUPP3334 TaxID=2920881 RepID=UPI0023DE47F7|nr:UPF0149 family protein [Acidovorax sp. SUPP3334]GKT25211.1 hypothetical protein AVHM3334_17260 [Acidovorax sp. SUPP3334]
MTDEIELIHSPLTQTYRADGHTLHIQIYRSSDSPWVLEVEDELGTSTVWEDPFETDKAALETALLAIESEGIRKFVVDAHEAAQDAAPDQLHALAQQGAAPAPLGVNDLFVPLTEEELAELDQFLLHELETEEGMTLDTLDGYLHAIAIAPEFIHPDQWLPKVWGYGDAMMPPMPSLDAFNRLLGLVMRHYNGIVSGFAAQPPMLSPIWGIRATDHGEFDDAEMWAYGFCEGVQLNRPAWQPLLRDPEGQRWYRPIGLLGEGEFSADQDALTRTPQQRHALAADIGPSLLQIHAFWLPVRHAASERQPFQRSGHKVGRNEPCPCGSDKKFKKCCGAPSKLH